MHKDLELVSSDFHGALGGLHGFGVLFFVLRFIRSMRLGRIEIGLLGWAGFHLAATVVSFFCAHAHARDSH